ncbi:MAG: iron ABC transporter permease [Armatimonadetes bacterium]|nr:iron ABC transporter permease [Armatimonadota bacterium]
MASRRALFAGVAALTGLSLLASLTIGDQPIPVGDVWRAIVERGGDDPNLAIVWELRAPRALLALLAGLALGAVGAAFQGVFRNALADPYITGVSSGAALGAASATLLGWAESWSRQGTMGIAFLSALATLLVVAAIARRGGSLDPNSFLLAGIALGSTLWAAITVIVLWSGQDYSRVIYWLMGGFSSADWSMAIASLPLAFLSVLALLMVAGQINVYSLGNDTAQHLGVDLERLKWIALGAGSLAVAAVVSFCGIIGFVGLIAPHAARRLVGADHRSVMPLAAMLGGIGLIWADCAARTIARPAELPVGALTALIGAPLFIVLLMRRNRHD